MDGGESRSRCLCLLLPRLLNVLGGGRGVGSEGAECHHEAPDVLGTAQLTWTGPLLCGRHHPFTHSHSSTAVRMELPCYWGEAENKLHCILACESHHREIQRKKGEREVQEGGCLLSRKGWRRLNEDSEEARERNRLRKWRGLGTGVCLVSLRSPQEAGVAGGRRAE